MTATTHWQHFERCIRRVYYDVESGRLTHAYQIDDRMLDCVPPLVDLQNRIKQRRVVIVPEPIRALQERDVQPEPRE